MSLEKNEYLIIDKEKKTVYVTPAKLCKWNNLIFKIFILQTYKMVAENVK